MEVVSKNAGFLTNMEVSRLLHDRQRERSLAREAAKASALNELLGEETEYQQAQADRIGDQVAASFDDVIRRYVSQQWRRPPTARTPTPSVPSLETD